MARVAGVLGLGSRGMAALSNKRVLQPGGAASGALTRLANSVMMSLTHVAAGRGVARSRRANRYTARDHYR
jgi:hypothetical protein